MKSETSVGTVLFVHDGPIKINDEEQLIDHRFGAHFFSRYRTLGDSLIILSRFATVKGTTRGMERIMPCVTLCPVNNVKTLIGQIIWRRHVKEIVKLAVGEAEVVVVRLPSLIGSWAYKAARAAQKPVLVEFVACTWDSLWHYSVLGKILAPFLFLKNRWILAGATHVVYVTDHFLQERYPTNGRSINCSNVNLADCGQEVLNSRYEWIRGINSRAKVVITTVAAIDVRYKDQEVVIRAIAELGLTGQVFHYRMIGQGDPKRLNALAKKLGVSDKVEFVGAVPHTEVNYWLDHADVYVQPSRVEGLPRALIEAMRRGCPALGSDAGGIPELLPSNRIFRKGDYKALSQLLIELNQDEMERDARRNFQKAAEFNSDLLAKRRTSFFRVFLEQSQEKSSTSIGDKL